MARVDKQRSHVVGEATAATRSATPELATPRLIVPDPLGLVELLVSRRGADR
jgi:hypothetical protein